jgi:hypothetical protein
MVKSRWPLTQQTWDVKVKVWERMAHGEKDAAITRWSQLNLPEVEEGLDRGTISRIREELLLIPEWLVRDLPETVRGYRAGELGLQNSPLEVSSPVSPPAHNAMAISKHDVEIFEKSDALMSNVDIRGVTDHLEYGQAYKYSHLRTMVTFRDFFTLESNRYVAPELDSGIVRLCTALTDLCMFLASSAFTIVGDQNDDINFKLDRYHEVLRNREIYSQEAYDSEYTGELDRLVEAVKVAYRNHRVHILQTLHK